jgi:hypothetical protein
MPASADTSKKQSGLNLLSPPEPLVFFVDRSLGRHVIPDALRAAGVQVELHDDHFPQDAQDQIWLAEAGKRGWIVLTKDKHLLAGSEETHTEACRAKQGQVRSSPSGCDIRLVRGNHPTGYPVIASTR